MRPEECSGRGETAERPAPEEKKTLRVQLKQIHTLTLVLPEEEMSGLNQGVVFY